MPPCSLLEDLVIRLLDGRSEHRALVLEGGRPRRPFTVGSRSDWRVDAGHVATAHVMLAFNGVELYVRALPGEKALLDGAPLDARWVVARLPSELRFGSARLVIGRRYAEEADVSVSPAAHSVRAPRVEEVTCADDERLQAALRLSASSTDVTGTAEIEMLAARRGPALTCRPPPLRRPSIRPLTMFAGRPPSERR
jgi:hypothetical protein